MKAFLRISLASVLSTFLFLGPGLANEAGQGPGIPLEQLYPGPLGMADFGKIVSGEFTGDLKRDAVVMDGNVPKLLVAPETFDSAITVQPSANDIAVLSGVLPGKDFLLTVSSAGLVRHERNSASASWSEVTIRGSGTSWINAGLVAVAQIDGLGLLDIACIAGDGRTVLLLYGNSDGTYTNGPSFLAYSQGITDLWLLNWREFGTPGTCELALNSLAGVEVRGRNGNIMDAFAFDDAPMLGTVITDVGTPVQRLALVTVLGGLDTFWVYGDTQTENYFSLGAIGVVSMASADADSDGDTEVFLNVDTERKFSMLESHSGSGTTFVQGEVTKFLFGPSGRNPAYNHAGLAPGDFDSDGKLDMLCGAQGDPGPAVAIYSSMALVNVESDVVAGWRTNMSHAIYITSTNEMEFRFTRPDTILPHPAGAQTKLGVKIYHTDELGVGTEAGPVVNVFLPLPQPYDYSAVRVQMPEGFSLQNSTDLYSFVVRQSVRDTATGKVLDIAPAMTAIFSPEPSVATITQAPKTILVVPVQIDPNSSSSYGGVDIGPTVPSMPAGIEPVDGDP